MKSSVRSIEWALAGSHMPSMPKGEIIIFLKCLLKFEMLIGIVSMDALLGLC